MRFGMFDTIRWHDTMTGEDPLNNALEHVEFADRLEDQDIWLDQPHLSRHGTMLEVVSLMGVVT